MIDLTEEYEIALEKLLLTPFGLTEYGTTSLVYDFSTRFLPSVLMIGFFFYLTRFSTKGSERIPVSYWITMTFTSAFTIIWGLYSFPEYFAENYATRIRCIVSLGLLIINLMIYYLFYRITMQYEENLELKVMQQRMALDKTANEDMNRMYLNLRQVRHDLLNHIGIMDSLLTEKHYPELEEYFHSLQQKEAPTLNALETGNIAVNALLNRKVAQIEQLNIPIQTKVLVPPQSPIADMDLCSIFANLLDNHASIPLSKRRRKEVKEAFMLFSR